jgi:ABC-type transport system involved in multi-copper enzyme maturation permease subunit
MSRAVFVETVRRYLVSPAYLATVIGLGGVAAIIGALAPGSRQWHGFISVVIVVLGASLIGPEFSRGTLQIVLTRPIRRSTYLMSRYAGVVTAIWIAVFAGLAGQLAGIWMAAPEDPKWLFMMEAAGTLAIAALLVCALLALFGTFVHAYFNAALYIVLQIVFALVLTTVEQLRPDMPGMIGRLATFLREHPQIAAVLNAIADNLFPERPEAMHGPWAILVISNAAVAILLACLVFRRREVPYGAD